MWRITCRVSNPNSRHFAALAFVGWYLMIPPDSAKIPHSVNADVPLAHWIKTAGFDTEENCEKALADLQNKEEDPIDLDKTGKLARFRKKPPDAALGKARAVNAACVASDDFRLKGK
jgi:hypothetical protein